jgi:hemoglobin-like flavoprotein
LNILGCCRLDQLVIASAGFARIADLDSSSSRKNSAMNIQESLQEILEAKDRLAKMFYEHFLEEHPELRPFFAKVDLERQQILLTTGLMVIARQYTHPTPAVEQYLQYLGTKHHQLQIPRAAYAKWTDAMLVTMQRFHGPKWSEDLELQWRAAVEQACDLMFQGYEERITV